MNSRLNGAIGSSVGLNVQFLQNGEKKDPTAIRMIKIYKNSVCESNLVLEIPFPTPDESDISPDNPTPYDGLVTRCRDENVPDEGQCGTDVTGAGKYIPGCFVHELLLCSNIFSPGCYYDVWCFVGCIDSACTNVSAIDWNDESLWLCQCNKFFVNPCNWYVDDQLNSIKIGFEPLDSRYQQPEIRWLEVGIMPLPLFDYDSTRMSQIIPNLSGTITIMSQYGVAEIIVNAAQMQLGLRDGSYRSSPYVFKYLLDTSGFLKGTYKYRVDVKLPDGQTRSSPLFNLSIR